MKNENGSTIQQIEKHFQLIQETFGIFTILVTQNIPAFSRKRLIEKSINFIVPGKQMYLPALMVDLRETYSKPQSNKQTLLPSAQCIILYHILHRNEKIEEKPLKQIAEILNYTPMAISKAVGNLRQHNLCQLDGTREKFIRFTGNIPELWQNALPLLVSPVLNRVFADNFPQTDFWKKANETALPEYSDMSGSKQEYLAIDRGNFIRFRENDQVQNLNDYEGKYCIEVWKYSPVALTKDVTKQNNVDPLSLYLSLKDHKDERIEMALAKIIENYIW
jgi:DNA-binding MarR family transcriptional regulator